jgi:hypothetical protein
MNNLVPRLLSASTFTSVHKKEGKPGMFFLVFSSPTTAAKQTKHESIVQ